MKENKVQFIAITAMAVALTYVFRSGNRGIIEQKKKRFGTMKGRGKHG